MFFSKRRQEDARKEAEVQSIRRETIDSLDKLNDSTARLIQELEKNWDITKAIYIAIGGNRRNGRR